MGRLYAVGLVIMNDERFLVLESETGYWAFFKELVERGDDLKGIVRNIVKEDLGVVPFIVKGFEENEEYFFKEHGETIHKEVVYCLVEVSSREVNIPVGYLDHDWLCYADAMRKLSFKRTKEVLEKAHEFLLNR
jgi:hypothetical protein